MVEIVAALIDGSSTLKRLIKSGRQTFLRAENPRYRDLIPLESLTLQGVLVGVKRLYLQGQDDQPTGTFTFSDVLARELAREEPASAISRRG